MAGRVTTVYGIWNGIWNITRGSRTVHTTAGTQPTIAVLERQGPRDTLSRFLATFIWLLRNRYVRIISPRYYSTCARLCWAMSMVHGNAICRLSTMFEDFMNTKHSRTILAAIRPKYWLELYRYMFVAVIRPPCTCNIKPLWVPKQHTNGLWRILERADVFLLPPV